MGRFSGCEVGDDFKNEFFWTSIIDRTLSRFTGLNKLALQIMLFGLALLVPVCGIESDLRSERYSTEKNEEKAKKNEIRFDMRGVFVYIVG
jgi:hypothetical protein